ncbi:hypothetical protein OG756_33755 [Streptomyces sp. NBC_01310]|uniref:hypothetical protein n=1 Tax=Streptomyces sp. NBC_01310 TaxID=2903820 RepID=UPI0035B617B4|nr:hypothetical protein OG756_33755 [Streptomyces sp. NBC_01310]
MSDDARTAAASPEDALRSARLLARAEAAVMALFATRAYELGWTVRSQLSGILDHVTLSWDAGHSTQVTPVTALHPKLGSTIVRAPEGSGFLLGAGMEHMAVPGTTNLAAFPMALEECKHCARKRWEEAARASFAAYAIETDLRSLADATSPNGYPAKEVRCLHGHEFTITAMNPPTPGRVPGCTYGFTTGFDGAGEPCVTCLGISQTPKLVEFRRRAREQNVMVMDVMSDRIAQTVRLCCVAGHLTSVGINTGLKRELLCARCSGAGVRPEPTVYYVVTDGAMVKPGISSGDGRGRLDAHRSQHGLGQVRRLITELPVGAARDVERHVLDCLASQGVRPVMGSEYFDAARIDQVLELADGWFAANLPNLPWTVTA